MEPKERNAKGNVVTNGRRIDFLGYCFNHQNTRLRKSTKKNFAIKSKRVKNPQRRQEILAAYWGWCKWANCKNLWNTLTENNMSFAEKGIKGITTTKDGKDFYDVPKVRIDSIINTTITVMKFQTGITTPHGKNRYVVKILDQGIEKKFITNSFTLKSMLDQAKELDVLPLDTIIRKKDIGEGKYDYTFE